MSEIMKSFQEDSVSLDLIEPLVGLPGVATSATNSLRFDLPSDVLEKEGGASSEAEPLKFSAKSPSCSCRLQENVICLDVKKKRAKIETSISEEKGVESCSNEEKSGSCDFEMPWQMKKPLMEPPDYENLIISPPEKSSCFNLLCEILKSKDEDQVLNLSVKHSSHGNHHQQDNVDVRKKKKKAKAKFKQSIGEEDIEPCRHGTSSKENGIARNIGKVKKPLVELSAYESFIISPAEKPLRFSLPCASLSSEEEASSFAKSLILKFSVTDDIHGYEDTAHGSNGYREASLHGKDTSSCKWLLLQSKYSIMEVSLKYGDDIWSLSSQIVNPYEMVPGVAIDVLNRAFFKMWELMQLFPNLVPENTKLFSAHLCEGPGGFIQSLLMYRSQKRANHGKYLEKPSPLDYQNPINMKGICDTWFAITLATPISHREALKMDLRKLEESIDEFVEGYMHYGADDSGDITNPGNISSFVDFTLQKANGKKMHLITGDGAFEISDNFSLQEHSHTHLLYCEMMIALQLQCDGGSFILKLFDCFSESTRIILCILTSLYTKVEIVRLRTSRVCNSERYLVAQGFLGMPNALKNKLMNISNDWYNAITGGLTANLCYSKDLPCSYSSALDSSNIAIANEQIASILRAVGLAHKLGERLSLIDGAQHKRVVSILKRKLKDMHKLKVNALLLCQTLNIPVLGWYR